MDRISCNNICGQIAKNDLQMFQCKNMLCPQTIYKAKGCDDNLPSKIKILR